MQRILLFSILLSVSYSVSAQDFKVSVRLGGDPVALAYVLVNGRAAALSDSTGTALLDRSVLQYGDRLSVSHVGTGSEEIVFTPEVAEAGGCTIQLTANHFMSEVVFSTKVDGWAVFNKYARVPMVYEKRHDTKLNFVFTAGVPGEADRTVSGKILMNRNNSNLSRWNYEQFAQNLIVDTRDDTTALREQLLTDLFFTLQVANGAIYRLGVSEFRDPDSYQARSLDGRILFSFQSQGVDGGERIFLVTNKAYEFGSSRPLRYLFRVDNRNKRIVSSESEHVLPQSRFNQRTSATYDLYRLRWLKPETAELESVNPESGISYRLSLSDIGYNNLTRREKRQLYPKEDIRKARENERYRRREEQRKKRERQDLMPTFY